jgi:hypothetical protein
MRSVAVIGQVRFKVCLLIEISWTPITFCHQSQESPAILKFLTLERYSIDQKLIAELAHQAGLWLWGGFQGFCFFFFLTDASYPFWYFLELGMLHC